MRVERVWVCEGCAAPKSDGELSVLHYGVIAIGVLAFLGYAKLSDNAPAAPAPASSATAAPEQAAAESSGAPEIAQAPEQETTPAQSEPETSAETGSSGSVQVAEADSPAAATSAIDDPSLAYSKEELQDPVLRAQLARTAEMRRQSEEEEARINREAEEQERNYAEQSARMR